MFIYKYNAVTDKKVKTLSFNSTTLLYYYSLYNTVHYSISAIHYPSNSTVSFNSVGTI